MLKKILAFAMALLVVVSMAACSRENEDNKEKDDETTQNEQNDPATEDQQSPDTQDSEGTQTPDTTPDENDPTVTPANPEDEMSEVSEEVYATVTVDLRSAPEISADNVVGVLRYGQRATRIKVGDEWSKITYQDAEYFVATNCLALYDSTIVLPGDEPDTPPAGEGEGTGEQPTTPPDTSDFVTLEAPQTVYVIAESALNLRSAPGMDGEVKVKVAFGTKMQRVAMNDTWSEVVYNGQTYYAFSEFLTADDISGEGYTILAAPQTYYVTASSLWIRYYPSMVSSAIVPYTVLSGLHEGDAVQVVAFSPDNVWARVVIAGTEYYVGNQYLTNVAPDGSVEEEEPILPGK